MRVCSLCVLFFIAFCVTPPSTGGSALRIRVTVTTFAMLTRTGTRTITTRTIAMGLRRDYETKAENGEYKSTKGKA